MRVCASGLAAPFDESALKKRLDEPECNIRFAMRGNGKGQAVFWTCDLTEGYIDDQRKLPDMTPFLLTLTLFWQGFFLQSSDCRACDLLANLASALSEGNQVRFMGYVDKSTRGYQDLQNNVGALIAQNDVSASLDVLSESGDDDRVKRWSTGFCKSLPKTARSIWCAAGSASKSRKSRPAPGGRSQPSTRFPFWTRRRPAKLS